jgi:uroporphyrinogen-III synthase
MVSSLFNLFERPSSLEKLELFSIGAKTRDALQNTSLTLDRITLDDGPETTLSDWEIVFGPSRVH